MVVTWTIESAGGVYDKTPGAENTFRWTIHKSAFTNYNAFDCQGYDTSTGNITGTITVKNKAATPVAITGTDSSIAYTGATVDVSQYFSIDTNAGTATYALVTGTNGGTGKGTLSGTTLTVTQTGTFKIKVSTVANGIFAAGEKTVTLTVDNGTILYTATDYSTTYDGQPHSISVSVTNPEGAAVTYSTDGTTYGSDNPSFSNEGTYTVYYRITKDNYTTVEGSKTVTINKKPVTITAQEQDHEDESDLAAKFVSGKIRYKITGKKEAAVIGLKTKKVTKVKIPSAVSYNGRKYNVTEISADAFKKSSVTEVVIADSVKEIGTSAFLGCKKLVKVTIGANTTKIGAKTFKDCSKLKTIIVRSKKLKRIGKNTFSGIKKNAQIKVPAAQYKKYKKLFRGKGQGKKVVLKKYNGK